MTEFSGHKLFSLPIKFKGVTMAEPVPESSDHLKDKTVLHQLHNIN